LRYVNGTKDFGIKYSTSKYFRLTRYTDSDCGGNIDGKKRTSGYTFHFGTSVVSWESRKESIVTLSSTEEEYFVSTRTTCEAVCMRRILKYSL
jgi:hypothetical protein